MGWNAADYSGALALSVAIHQPEPKAYHSESQICANFCLHTHHTPCWPCAAVKPEAPCRTLSHKLTAVSLATNAHQISLHSVARNASCRRVSSCSRPLYHVTSKSGRDHDCPHHFHRVQTSSGGHPGAHSVCRDVPFPVTKRPECDAQFRMLPLPSYAYTRLMPLAAGI